jgi:hypothetical protein
MYDNALGANIQQYGAAIPSGLLETEEERLERERLEMMQSIAGTGAPAGVQTAVPGSVPIPAVPGQPQRPRKGGLLGLAQRIHEGAMAAKRRNAAGGAGVPPPGLTASPGNPGGLATVPAFQQRNLSGLGQKLFGQRRAAAAQGRADTPTTATAKQGFMENWLSGGNLY